MTGDIILYDGHLAVYRHSLDLIFYMLGGPLENELMLHAALSAFMDALHLLLRNQVEKRAVLENLDCVILCLDETIDDGCVPLAVRRVRNDEMDRLAQDHCRDGPDDDHVTGEPSSGGHDGDCDQRADYIERVSDCEGEDATKDWTIVAGAGIYSSRMIS